jgi:DNA-binding MarR family transcriptional regulator
MPVKLQDVSRKIKQLQHRQHWTLESRLAPLGITLVQWDALRAISQNPGASSHKLAEVTFQTDQSFGALAGRMVANGLIERVAGRGRALQHQLTAEGEKLLHEGNLIMDEVMAEAFAPLSTAEIETLYDLLTQLAVRTED